VAALTEMHRVLKSGGTVVFIWNLEDRATPWVARLREAYEKHEAGSPQYRLGLWRRPFEEAGMVETLSRMFRLPYQERQFKHVMTNTSNGVWQRVLSKSYIAVLSPAQKEELKKQVDRILEGDDVHWYTREEGGERVLDYPYNTDVVWFQKLE
jgi:ubiquinone/menaquinone biosynthesis C-methylase UbiE